MKIGRVVGTVVTPVQHPAYAGKRLLAVRPVDPDGRDAADRLHIAVDRAQAGIGDRVLLLAEGSSVRALLGEGEVPVRCAVVAVLDEIEVDGRRLYPAATDAAAGT
jgi:microcompartment protein CcmK/EutM